jgi:hypothetical protein
MTTNKQRKQAINTEHFCILNVTPPFVDICLQSTFVSRHEFSRIAGIAASYPGDARLIEMVRMAGDASGKIPYLLDAAATPDAILAALREVARPQIERFQGFPEALQSTICLLLSINKVPHGCEPYALTALLEIDRMQVEMLQTLRDMMSSRRLAQDFHRDNLTALQQLDQDWPRLRNERSTRWHTQPLPEEPQMQYHPVFDHRDRLVGVRETCVIVDAPRARLLKRLTPPVLQRPLPAMNLVPSPRSVDWLIRDSGKVGRHFTRALLEIIKTHLRSEQVALETGNYELINRGAQDALDDYVHKTP